MAKDSRLLTDEEAFERLQKTLFWSSLENNDFFDVSPVVTYEDAIKYPSMESCVGNFAVFPKPLTGTEAEKEAEWERKAILMHENQKPIRLEPKPTGDNALTRKFQRDLERGD